MKTVRNQLSKAELERLFLGAVDKSLGDRDEVVLKASLDAAPELKSRFSKYEKVVSLLKRAPKEKAPEALASMILRRSRRRRVFDRRGLQTAYAQYRVPAEVLIPILLGVLVAAFLIYAAP